MTTIKRSDYPCVIWTTRINTRERPYQAVQPVDGPQQKVKISFFPGKGQDGISIEIPRGDARLLAKRINQCLTATKGSR